MSATTATTTLADHLDDLRTAVDAHQAFQPGPDILVDVQTANAILTVRGALSDRNRAKLDAMPLVKAGLTCWKLIGSC